MISLKSANFYKNMLLCQLKTSILTNFSTTLEFTTKFHQAHTHFNKEDKSVHFRSFKWVNYMTICKICHTSKNFNTLTNIIPKI